MSDTKIIIQARTGSTRLPQKMILPFFDGEGVFSLILCRMTKKINKEEEKKPRNLANKAKKGWKNESGNLSKNSENNVKKEKTLLSYISSVIITILLE